MAATKKERQLRKRAAAAAFTLLGIPSAIQAGQSAQTVNPSLDLPTPDPWSIDTSFLSYSEAERIDVLEPQVGVRRDFSDNRSLDILVTVDSISGATPLGTLPATAKTAPNTVTNASGQGTNPIIGKVPLANMTDTREAIDTSWQQPLGTNYKGEFGVDASKETDYASFGADTKLSRDFNQKNTTLALGFAPEYDLSYPNGGIPVPLSTQFASGSIQGSQETKTLLSSLAGITQVINRKTVMQFNVTYTHEQGYLNDPYKLLSLVDADGNPTSAIYENRPRYRNEESYYWLMRYNMFANDVFSLSYRYYNDDWGIYSHTLDFTYRRQSSDRFYWQPHVRYYQQSSANFYYIGLSNNQPLPQYASADLRLAAFTGVTFGVSFGYTLKNGSLFIVRWDYYTQTGESFPQAAVGAQRSFDLFPTLYASIIQVEYHFQPSQLFSFKHKDRYQ